MKHLTLIATLPFFALATEAPAGSMVDSFCGAGHANEVLGADDVQENPDGFYIRSLQVQLSHGDPRLIKGVGSVPHLCTASAATPEMDTGRALLLMNERRVKYLFVPNDCPKGAASS